MVDSNIGPNSAPLRDISYCNPSDLDFDLSGSLKGKSDDVIELARYGFPLMINSKIGPNSAPLRDIRHWNLSDLDFDLSRSLKIKTDSVIGLIIYGFLLMVSSNTEPNSAWYKAAVVCRYVELYTDMHQMCLLINSLMVQGITPVIHDSL